MRLIPKSFHDTHPMTTKMAVAVMPHQRGTKMMAKTAQGTGTGRLANSQPHAAGTINPVAATEP